MPAPFEKEEYKQQEQWYSKVKDGEVHKIPCIAQWTDVCGFGSGLTNGNWDLTKIAKSGLIELLGEVYRILANCKYIGIEPMPYEVALVLNDGIAKSIDMENKKYMHSYAFLLYLRDIVFSHYRLIELTKRFDLGIRTVLAGGERMQYSNPFQTGQSLLYHDEKHISEFGEKLLDTIFVYNPEKFQMNTAFAKAYTIESLGGRSGISVGGLYIEKTYWDILRGIKDVYIQQQKDRVVIYLTKRRVLEFIHSDYFPVDCKGQIFLVARILKMIINEDLDGDDVEVDLCTG